MSDREVARHRSPQRPVTFLTDAGEVVTGRIAVVGRTSAVLAASTGMLATGGLPISGSQVAAAPITSVEASATGLQTTVGGMSAGLLSATSARSSTSPLSAPMTATVTFESNAFRAVPRRVVSPVKVAAVVRAVSTRRAAAPAESAPTRQAAKAAKAAAVHTSAAQKTASDSSKPAAPPKARKHVATSPAKTKHVEAPSKRATDTAPPKKSKHVAPPKQVKHAPAPKQPHAKQPQAKKPQVKKPTQAPAGSVRSSSVLAIAARYVGTPYIYGGTTPRGFDCSGYVGYVYRQLGVRLPRTANQQMQATHRVSRSQARPGDLVFFVSGSRAYHVGIYAGGGQMYDSPRTGKTIQKRAIWSAAVVFGRVAR
ncbi:MAG TPA: NlpC/P60 family protein [Kineosporiaceae bacterium]|nr:NlpC/P60 family protein [Kineosporiaceae bacterium]